MALVSVNPATGRRLAAYREPTAPQIDRALSRATTAATHWRARTVAQRSRQVAAIGRALRVEAETLAAIATAEMGKPMAQARTEVAKCAALCDYCAQHGAALLADEQPVGAPPNARVVFDPLGTVLAIMPWNFPFWQAARAVVPALLSGNTVLLKHASNVSGCALALERVFTRSGLPRGVFQTLLVSSAAIPAILADRRVHGVTLTGSTTAGRLVAALAGAAMKPGVYELGGSDPAIVLADADLAHAAETCAQARLLNAGQSCISAKRFIVERSVLREFEARFVARMAARQVGDPTDPATEVGPLARGDLRDEVHSQVTRSVAQGARLLLGGAPLPGRGFFYAPTVLTGVRAGMAVHDEEVFGPVAAIIPVRDAAEAIRVANNSEFGLGASLFTRNLPRARRLARAIEAGNVFINDFVRSYPELPFGGVKQSGHGRELGVWGLRSFVNVKTVWTA